MNLWQMVRSFTTDPGKLPGERMTFDEYVGLLNAFSFGGNGYSGGVQQTLVGGDEAVERSGETFAGLVHSAYAANGVVFACMLARQMAFSSVRFQWQTLNNGRPSKMFGTKSLEVLERPWVGGTTQDLLTRVINDADLAGSSYSYLSTPLARLGGDGGQEIVRLRPDWVQVALVPRMVRGSQVGWRRVGYIYAEGGFGYAGDRDTVAFTTSEVAQFTPVLDPLASWRGMSWLTPVIREIQADHQMTRHKAKFFENGATPNMVVKYPVGVPRDEILKLAKLLEVEHGGVENAYRTMHFGGGADVTVVGANMEQVTFKELSGVGETRIAAAARVSPVIVGLSEGLQGSALNAGNYGQARRQFADGTCHPMWQGVSGSFEPLLGPRPGPSGTRLWYDTREVPFLREDEKDAASIQQMEANTIRTLLDAGYTADSVREAVEASDWGLLKHSGMFSVQLQTPGAASAPPASADPAPVASPEGQPA